MTIETKIPGLKVAHVWSTEQCRLRGGEELDEALQKLREKYNEIKDAPSNTQAKIHFVLTLEWPENPEEDNAPDIK